MMGGVVAQRLRPPTPAARRAALGFMALLMGLAPFAWAQPVPQVRVLLAELSTLTARFDGPHRGAIDGRSFEVALPLAWPVHAHEGRLWVDGLEVGDVLDLTSDDGFVWAGVRYRGTLRLLAQDQSMLLINVLDIETYLRGVVPAEMQASWPLEALKAQAVAARTYTLGRLDPSNTHDLCATVDCQVYRGAEVEHPATDAAVLATAGEVLLYDGDYARTYYHSDSGGAVASSLEVWGSALPYLQAKTDVASNGPHAQWTARLDPQRMRTYLVAAGFSVGTPTRVQVLEVSSSGRALRATISGTQGSVTLAGTALRLQLRAWGLRSTRIVMTGDLSVRGQGWGHGVGMSQYGARERALSGNDYRQILAFYYPGTTLTGWEAVVANRTQP